MISGHCRTALAPMFQIMLLEAISEEDWLILTLAVMTTIQLVNDFTDLRHNAFVTSASSDKMVSAFHLFP